MNVESFGLKSAQALAQAKVNLALHITGQRADGFHLLDSLVVFPKTGDIIEAQKASKTRLELIGPFSHSLLHDDPVDNLVLRAAHLLEESLSVSQPVALRLEKNLPVAAGIGGGSADAAATLFALCQLWGIKPDHTRLSELAAQLGADVPMCLNSKPCRVRGIGDQIENIAGLPAFAVVLVNPKVNLSTPAVFKQLAAKENGHLPKIPNRFESIHQLCEWLKATRNDLQTPAISLVPQIQKVLDVLEAQHECLFARMSGSGATCFAICTDLEAAERLAVHIKEREDNWWVQAAAV
ncbi:4-(cytidine 5'-diphospho)-2-C-methyl-D-erythritol kinase [Polycladidibacter stylochi]|uniref:4-(cytidine 5'-diphospho)-2-C-methyl-D-erythritol kinase n=1 Tax=Polycladidibacter stylochi TaxID=1807766 RepID=UPI0008371BAE|nr:4-(cytidine 5'-diphospho)-2-C-methyl-D-erythritol kinase [Pseudovibrio stylochi]